MLAPRGIASTRPVTLGGADRFVAAWVARELDMASVDEFGPCSAMGVTIGDQLVAGVVFNEYRRQKHGASMQASIASTTPRWASRRVLGDIFAYPFVQMRVTRLWASTSRKNRKAKRFLERLGFRMEGIARRAHDGRTDAAVYSMMPEACRWIGGGNAGR